MRRERVQRTSRRQAAELIVQLDSSDAAIRAHATEQLGLLGHRSLSKHLIARTADKSAEVRMRAVEALGRLRVPSGNVVANALFDRDELVRVAAAEAVSRKRIRNAASLLGSALNDRSPLVRRYVAIAMGTLRLKQCEALMLRRLEKEESDSAKVGLFEGLWMMGQRTLLPGAMRLLDSDDYHVRCAMASALSSTFATADNRLQIVRALRSRLRDENTIAGKQAMRNALQHLRQPFRMRAE
jgi:HEAT repeat protein